MVDGLQRVYKMINVTAIILARGGSKGIPRKNVLDFCGKPLVAWSILQASETPEINNIFLSSDSEEILSIGKEYGAEIIERPEEFASDTASSESAILHALSVLDYEPDIVVMLEPTAPLRKPGDLSNAINLFIEESWDSGFSGAELEDFLIWKRDENNDLVSVNYDYVHQTRRQDRQPDYVENGAIYLFKPEILYKNNRFGGKIGISMMEFWQSFEIDSPEDWPLLETIFEKYILNRK